MMNKRDLPEFLTIQQVSERLAWSPDTLRRRLILHGISTIGRGRIARLTVMDFQRLVEAER